MPSNNTTLEEIKSRLDIVDIISEYISLKKTGQNWKGLCPFHSEKTPSFIVSPSKQIYRCFGCGSGGDIFTFLIKYEDLSFQESLNALAKKAGVTLKKSKRHDVVAGEKENLRNLHKDAGLFYQYKLKESQKALRYLKNRGINAEAQRLFSIGYAPNRWNELFAYLQKKGYEVEIIKKAGLITHGTKGYYDTFRDRIIFPIFDLRSEAIAFGGRVMDESMPKYLNSSETPIFSKGSVLYGLNIAKNSIKNNGFAIFVEGYFDVITAHMHGFTNTVAPLGTALTPEHGKLIKRFTHEVAIVFDSDISGIKAAKNALGILLENNLDVNVLPLPEGEDPDSLLKKHGKDAFADLLKKNVSFVDFFLMQKKDKYLTCNEAVETIAKIPNSIVRGDYVKLLSEKTKYNERDIREQLLKIMKKPRSKSISAEEHLWSSEIQTRLRPKDEIYLLQLILQFPEKTERVFDAISAEDLEDPVIKPIFKKIKAEIDSSRERSISYDKLISECEGDAKNLLAELAFKNDFEDPEKVFQDCLNRLRTKKRQILLYELQDRITKAELEKNNVLLKTLLLEKQKLHKLKNVDVKK